jgi:hypothetical protein
MLKPWDPPKSPDQTGESMSTPPPEPTEEEMRAAYEAELARIRVEHVLLEQVVTLVNLGMRRTGLAPGTEAERDPGQVALAIDSIKVLLPLLERVAPEQIGPIRQALSQLQLAFVRIGGQAPGADRPAGTGAPGAGAAPGAAPGGQAPGSKPGAAPPSEPDKPGDPGPAQRSGRLWIPGQ